MQRSFRISPDNPTGAPLNRQREWLSVVVPESTVNLFLNPSWEANTSNWTATSDGSTGTPYDRTTARQFKGVYSAILTIRPTGGTFVQIVGPAVTSGQDYTISFYVRRPNGGIVRSADVRAVVNGAATGFDRISYVADGWWRCEKSYRATSTSAPGIRVQGAPGAIFYVDAAQLENKLYATTYCDGDQQGLLAVERVTPFRWNGTPHASTSTRSAITRAGGRVVGVDRYGLTILGLVGLGFSPRSVISTPLGLLDGSLYQRTIREARGFTVAGAFEAKDPRTLSVQRGALRSLFSHDLSGDDQPVLLMLQRYEGLTAIGAQLQIVASYLDGLGEELNQLYSERVSVQFQQFDPLLASAAGRGATLDSRDDTSIAYLAVRNRATGAWSGLGSLNAVPQNNAMAWGPDQKLYVGGNFTTPGTRVARYNFESAAWETLSTGLGQQVNALVFDPNGILYAGLNAAVTIGPNTGSIARWDGSAWSIIAGAPSDQIFALAYDPINLRLYTGGTTGGNATLRYWNGSTWTAVTIATAGIIYDLAYDPGSALLYIAGAFTNLNGSATLDNIASYTGSAFAQLAGGADNTVRSLALRNDGTLVAAGIFTTIGGITTGANNAAWNGRVWSELTGLEGGLLAGVPVIAVDPLTDQIYGIGDGNGSTLTATSVARPVVIYDNANAIRLPGALFSADNNAVNGFTFNEQYIIVSYNVSGTLPTAGVTSVTNPGTAPASPVIVFRGGATSAGTSGQDGVYQIINWTTGQQIGLNFVLFANEFVTLDCDTLKLVSNVRGDISSAVTIGSDDGFVLARGLNQLYAFTSDPTIRSIAVTVTFTPRFESLDDATQAAGGVL